MSQRKDGGGHDGDAPRAQAREFERGDVVLGRCVVDRCVRRDRLASFYSARAIEGEEVDGWCSVWSVHVGIVHRSDRAATAFFDEMQHAAAVSHPAIPAVIAFDPAAPGPVVLARQAEGTSLRDRLAEGELLDTREVAHIVSAVAEALEVMHGASPPIFHRAVTPERVITRDAQVYLEESGYAGALIASGLLTEKEVETFAQPGYRLPSKIARAGGARVDAFLLAIVAYEALTGQLPFGAASVSELDDLIERATPSARAARPTLPAEIDEVFRRAWSLDASRAHATPAAFARELARALEPNEHTRPTRPGDSAAIGALRRESDVPTRVVEPDDVDRAFDAMAASRPSSPPAEPPPTRKIDVEKLLPMVAAALHAGEESAARGAEPRQGRALPPVSRALELPPSKPTLLGASPGSSRGPSPFAPRPSRPPEPSHAPPLPPADAIEYERLSLEPVRDSLVEGSVSRPPDLTAEAELQDRLSAPGAPPPTASAPSEGSVVELDASFLEPSTTNTNLERIMDEIASFRAPGAESPSDARDQAVIMGEPLDDGSAAAVTAGHAARRATPVPGAGEGGDPLDRTRAAGSGSATLRPSATGPHPALGTRTPLPPLPTDLAAKRTPIPSIRPLGAKATPAEKLTPVPSTGRSGLPTTTPPPTRLSTPVPRGPATSARPRSGARPSAAPSSAPVSSVSMPPPESLAPPPAPAPVDGLARVAPMLARTNIVAALIATVGLIYASRQLDAYYSDPAIAPPRDLVRVDAPAPVAADAGSSSPTEDVVSARAELDAAVAPDVSVAAADVVVAALPDAATALAVADVVAPTDVATGVVASIPPVAQDAGASRRNAGVPGEAVHARVWSQLSRRVADCVEGIENYNSVTVFVRFDGATGMVQRIRARGVFGEPPVGPCLEQAVSGVRVPPFAATSWDTTFSFPIAPPRWRPPQ